LVYQQLFKKLFMNNKQLTTTRNNFSIQTLIAVSAALMLFVSGCKKFLDVPPKDQVPQATLFKDEQGFKDALIGVYMGMDRAKGGGSYALYTNDLSMGMLSTLAYNYDNATVANVGVGGCIL
jgi:hypothetical protein